MQSNDAEFCEEIVSAQKNDIDGTLDTFTEDTANKSYSQAGFCFAMLKFDNNKAVIKF